MNMLAVCAVAIAGASMAAHAQLVKMLVSSDGVNFSNHLDSAISGQTIQVLVTVSYTGTNTNVAGLSYANFQPTVSNWHPTDTLLPLRQGGNVLPGDGSGMIMPQFYTGTSAGDSGSSYGHIHAGYVPGTYGRVLPFGRTYLDGPNALTGFVHVNPDGSGQNYLRIAQVNNPAWIGAPGNRSGSGVNVGQLYVVGRVTADPDFWGNRDTIFDQDVGGFVETPRNPANDSRRQNIEVFRFAFTLDSSPDVRDMIVDAPVAGQDDIWYFTNASQPAGGLVLPPVVQPAIVRVNIPAPTSLPFFGLFGLALARRRRAGRAGAAGDTACGRASM